MARHSPVRDGLLPPREVRVSKRRALLPPDRPRGPPRTGPHPLLPRPSPGGRVHRGVVPRGRVSRPPDRHGAAAEVRGRPVQAPRLPGQGGGRLPHPHGRGSPDEHARWRGAVRPRALRRRHRVLQEGGGELRARHQGPHQVPPVQEGGGRRGLPAGGERPPARGYVRLRAGAARGAGAAAQEGASVQRRRRLRREQVLRPRGLAARDGRVQGDIVRL
mmetsp:Transcript_10071/g.20033  ORF Transcript_10071/g.20033 Transcript_10071/m.20033 type:complete len:218 (+) Transcript_10071:688-1341(+)